MDIRRVVLTGGGTLGPVTPLLAIVEAAREQHSLYEFFWIGTRQGPEREFVEAEQIKFFAISGGKLRRYVDWRNTLIPFQLMIGFWQSLALLRKLRPHAVVTAGAYISVPVVYAARWLSIPVIIHEMDIERGLANILMSRMATVRTTVWPRAGAKTIGNLVRASIARTNMQTARERLHIPIDAKVALITGGGTGAGALNALVWQSLALLPHDLWIFHLTGKGKDAKTLQRQHYVQMNYAVERMPDILAAADVVVTRAGMGTLSELASLKKVTIVIPMPETHQVANAAYLAAHRAAYVADQRALTPEKFTELIAEIFEHHDEAKERASALHIIIPEGTNAFMEILAHI